MTIEFYVEPRDPAAGIMTEGFMASVQPGRQVNGIPTSPADGAFCELVDIGTGEVQWFRSDGSGECPRPRDGVFVEHTLRAFAHAFYEGWDL